MAVYGSWLEKDRGLGVYRSATKQPARIATANSSNRGRVGRARFHATQAALARKAYTLIRQEASGMIAASTLFP